MILVANVDCTVTGKWILVNQIALTNTFFFCVPRKDSNYAPPNKVAKNAPKSSQNIILPIPSVEESHAQYAVSKRRGPKPVIVPACAKVSFVLRKLALLPVRSRYSPGNLPDTYIYVYHHAG